MKKYYYFINILLNKSAEELFGPNSLKPLQFNGKPYFYFDGEIGIIFLRSD